MRGLSLLQPWSSLVAVGAKQIETRSWRTGYRGPLLIHASARWGRQQQDLCLAEPFRSALDPRRLLGGRDLWAQCPTGAALAVAELADCVPTDAVIEGRGYLSDGQTWVVPAAEYAFGNYATGRWAWLLRDVRPLPAPVRCRGSIGLWDVPPAVLEAVRAGLGVGARP